MDLKAVGIVLMLAAFMTGHSCVNLQEFSHEKGKTIFMKDTIELLQDLLEQHQFELLIPENEKRQIGFGWFT